jgi:hypothetical protein
MIYRTLGRADQNRTPAHAEEHSGAAGLDSTATDEENVAQDEGTAKQIIVFVSVNMTYL